MENLPWFALVGQRGADVTTTPQRYWTARAAALARRVNTGAWLAFMAPATFFLATAFSIGLYALRRQGVGLTPAWWALAGAGGLIGLMCWLRTRRDFFSLADARVLLESQLRLDTRLTAAESGLVAWPAVPLARPAVVRWRMQAPAGWFAGAAVLVTLAVVCPLPSGSGVVFGQGVPPALRQAEELLAGLKELNVADPQAVDQLAERAQALARRASEEQYSHSGLEAADALRAQAVTAVTGLARGLDTAANAMRDAASGKGNEAGALAALSGLRDGALPAGKEFLGSLPGSVTDLRNLSAEQQAQLAQMLANAAAGMNGVAGAAGAGVPVAGSGPNVAAGGLEPGGETAPLMFNANASDVGQGTAEALSEAQLKRLALGDRKGLTSGAHDVDPAKAAGPTEAGAVAAPAAGGEAAWVNRLTPAERAVLTEFFK